ncbi:cupin-like domain-containing protein [Allosphingosinicella deserti]|uniref:cupin-like domain-containing protein n=1 Tax=Allosphingosinicella deserti TaxID=2116704 RepID=UPI001305050D|nr:cupin-like domain-containing protein [Sphingomonas deserti]
MNVRTSNRIERVSRPSYAALHALLCRQQPVIITGLFRGQPIDTVRDAGAASELFGDLPLEIRPDYSFNDFEAHRDQGRVPRAEMTFSAYMAFKQQHPGTRMLCLEQPTPQRILSLCDIGDYAKINEEDGDEIRSRLFVGNAGNRSNLHYDCDYHGALLYQVFGRKRVILIAPCQSQKLRPAMNFSEYLLCNFSPEDKADFIRYTHAQDDVLAPGEALLIPAAFWHHIEYLDDSMSINIRLKRNRYLRLLGGGLFHTDHVVQGLAAKCADRTFVEERLPGAFDHLLAVYTDRSLDPFAKYAALDPLFRKLHSTACPEAPEAPYFASLAGVGEAELWRSRLESGSLYGMSPIMPDAVPEERSRLDSWSPESR